MADGRGAGCESYWSAFLWSTDLCRLYTSRRYLTLPLCIPFQRHFNSFNTFGGSESTSRRALQPDEVYVYGRWGNRSWALRYVFMGLRYPFVGVQVDGFGM
jgi:hypothetical protein